MNLTCLSCKFRILTQIVLLFLAFPGLTQEKRLPLNLGYSSISAPQAIVRVIKDSGIFKRNGLDVNLIFIEGGTRAVQAMIGGHVPIIVAGGAGAIQARIRGGDALILMGLTNILDYNLISSPAIKRPRDLISRKIAISRYGSSSDFAVRYALNKWGLNPDKDVAILQIGNSTTRFAALKAGSVQATVLQPPLLRIARETGFTELVTAEQLDLAYTDTTIVTTASAVFLNEDLFRRVVKSFVEGIHFYKTRKEATLDSIGAFIRLSDRDALEETYHHYAKIFPRVPYPTLKGIQNILDQIAEKDPDAKRYKAESFVETRFLNAIEATGIIERLYR